MPRAKVFLTFDDSPDSACTEILDVLKAQGSKASFLLKAERLGASVDYHALGRRMINEGHALGISLNATDTPEQLAKAYSSALTAFQKLFRDKGDSFPGFKLARLAYKNHSSTGHVRVLTQQIGLPNVKWNFEFAPNNRLPHLKFPNWQGLEGIHASAQGIPAESDILLLHSPHWKGKKELLTKLVARLMTHRDLASLTPLPAWHAKIDQASPSTQGPIVYLTFDDGPYPITSQVVDVLNELQLNATFFLNMKWMNNSRTEQYRILRKMMDSGHFLGNHGIDHAPATRQDYTSEFNQHGTSSVKKDFEDNLKSITGLFKLNGKDFAGFQVARLPGNGSFFKDATGNKVFVDMVVKQLKVAHAGWDFEFFPNPIFPTRTPRINDWMQLTGVAAESAKHALPNNNSILLLHEQHWDGASSKKGTITQLRALLELLKQQTRVMPFLPLPASHPKIHYP